MDVTAFHERFDLEYLGKPRVLPADLHGFRIGFQREEIDEHEEVQAFLLEETLKPLVDRDQAMITLGLEKQLDAFVDQLYVTLGTAYLQGYFPMLEEAWRRVHRANMAKVRAMSTGDSTRGSTYDVVKPAGWTPPSHTDLVEDHAHRT